MYSFIAFFVAVFFLFVGGGRSYIIFRSGRTSKLYELVFLFLSLSVGIELAVAERNVVGRCLARICASNIYMCFASSSWILLLM